MPNYRELRSLVNCRAADNALLLDGKGIRNLRPAYYWTSTTYARDVQRAWSLTMKSGQVANTLKSGPAGYLWVWPVRGGLNVKR